MAYIIAFTWVNMEEDLMNENGSVDKVLGWWMIIIYSFLGFLFLCNFSKLQSQFWQSEENLENNDKKNEGIKTTVGITVTASFLVLIHPVFKKNYFTYKIYIR